MKWSILAILNVSILADFLTTRFLVLRGTGEELNPFYTDIKTFFLLNLANMIVFSLLLFLVWPNHDRRKMIRKMPNKAILKRLFSISTPIGNYFRDGDDKLVFMFFIIVLILSNAFAKSAASISNISVIIFDRGAIYFLVQILDLASIYLNQELLFYTAFLSTFITSTVISFITLKKFI